MFDQVIDFNSSFGKTNQSPYRYAQTPKELLDEMDYAGIDISVVHHARCRFGNPIEWNDVLFSELTGIERLIPAYTLLPLISDFSEHEKPGNHIANIFTKNNVRVCTMFPQEHNYVLDANTWKDALGICADFQIGICLKSNVLHIEPLLKEFPNIPFVLLNQGPHSIERYVRPLFKTYKNLFLETSSYIIDGALEEFCKLFGSNRLLFGSGYPNNCIGGSYVQVVKADITDEDRKNILYDNARRILRGEAV